MSKYILITGSDGTKTQLAGLDVLFYTLKANNLFQSNMWEIVVLHPSWITSHKFAHLQNKYGFKLININSKRNTDPYYVKIIISKFILESDLNNIDGVLYLDYDHYCLSSINLPIIRDGIVYVSSEVSPLNADDIKLNLLGGKHYNTSLIWSNPKTLRIAMQHWDACYWSLSSKVPERYLEEIAFSLAAITAGCDLVPISTTIQSNWYVGYTTSSLFHYGGEHPMARLVKMAPVVSAQKSSLSTEIPELPRELTDLAVHIRNHINEAIS